MDSLRGGSVKIGTMQRILAWLLRKDDTHTSRSEQFDAPTCKRSILVTDASVTEGRAALNSRGAHHLKQFLRYDSRSHVAFLRLIRCHMPCMFKRNTCLFTVPQKGYVKRGFKKMLCLSDLNMTFW